MSGIRCQLCDGVVWNGRCKTCGMLYRNDEILYHLNESSHDHYKHATPKAREIMRESRVPLGDKKSSAQRSTAKQTSQNKYTYHKNGGVSNRSENMSKNNIPKNSRLMSKEQILAQQEKVRQEAMAKINSTRVPDRNKAAKPKNNKKGLGIFWWILIIFYVVFGMISKNL